MVLHTVGYDGRSVAHRLSFAEMVVPYRDPTTDHYRRTAFDIGEWGLGFMTTSLELGCDCLGEIAYLDAVMHDTRGEPYAIPNAICIHEEDDAVLWKHVDAQVGAEVRRSRRLVLSFHVTVANYEYLVYWRFYQDGNIECEVRATGIMVTTHFAAGEQPPYGTLVDERTYAPFHQHFLVARLDLDVDGEANTVYATESEALPLGPDNPHGLALVQRDTPLRTEQEGKQDYDWQSQRAWKVVNESVTNALGTPVGYKLVPGGAFPPMMHPDSPVLRRAQAIGHTLWVTPFHAEERWPCGEFVVQSEEDRGLPVWTAQDRSIEDTDVVLWYVFGIHHITRPEEWPVMSVDTVSFWLKPTGFFDRNPALDVAPSDRHALTGGPMTEITNFIHGERVAAAGRADDRADRPQHRRGVRDRGAVAGGRRRRGVPGRRARVRGLARRHAERAPARAAADRRRDRGARRRARRGRVAEHRQAEGADGGGGGPADVRPDPLLRGRRARARGQVGRRVHERLHVLRPARAGRRLRRGDAVELPGDDGRLEVGARARRRQRDGAQAVRHDAGEHGLDGRADGRVPAAGRVQRRLRRPRHGRRAGQPPDPRDGVDHRQRRRRASRSPRRRPTTSSACTSSSAARRR